MKKIALKNAARGTAFDYAGQSWILLENDDGRALCLSKDIIETRAFDEGNCNNFAAASSKEYLNGAYLDNLLEDVNGPNAFLTTELDLTTDDGLKDYGTCTVTIFLLTVDQYRRNRDVIPNADDWWWLSTAFSTKSNGYESLARFVGTDGTLYWNLACYGNLGLRPACYLDSDLLISVEDDEATDDVTPEHAGEIIAALAEQFGGTFATEDQLTTALSFMLGTLRPGMSNLSTLFDRYKALVVFDTETSGLDFDNDQIIELAALRVERTATGGLRIAGKMDTFIKLPEGETLPENIVSLTGITDERLQTEGVQPVKAAGQIAKLMQNGPTLMIAHNAQFDAYFLRGLLRGQKVGRIDWLDSLTVYKDRRAYPHKLANAIIAYDLTGKVQNSHRAIDDVLALFEVLKAMDDEREDLDSYVNLFGYNPKYGVSGRRIVGVRYEPQSFSKGLTRPEQTLPARVARR